MESVDTLFLPTDLLDKCFANLVSVNCVMRGPVTIRAECRDVFRFIGAIISKAQDVVTL